MAKLIGSLMVIVLLGIMIMSCGNEPTSVESRDDDLLRQIEPARFILPDGTVLESATFYIYVAQASSQTVNLHRITNTWVETEVTWNNFGGSYDAGIIGSFTADGIGWRSADVTPLVQGWLDGTFDNFGLLLDQVEMNYPRTMYYSRENTANIPYLEICYTKDGETTCEQEMPTADSYIWQVMPTLNNGLKNVLYTGWARDTDLEKQSLLAFEIEPAPQLAALGDYVWVDENRDGIQDAEELGYPGVTVNLYDCAGNLLATTTTNTNGYYLFDDLTPGDYYVEFKLPEGYVFTMQDQGADDAADSDADVTTGMTICTTLDAGETDLTWDAGIYLREMGGCTLTIGFWKNHAGFGPQDDVVTPLLPIWLGNAGGGESFHVTTAKIAYDILRMHTYGKPSNGITKLYAQLLGTKLNIAGGADYADITDYLTDADAFLADNSWEDWNSLSRKDKHMVNNLKSEFDDYNNGIIGPGHCDD